MAKQPVSAVHITKVNHSTFNLTDDLLAVEEPLEIRLGFGELDLREQKRVAVTMRTPGNDFELALGFLYTEGIIQNPNDIYKIQYCTELNTIENASKFTLPTFSPISNPGRSISGLPDFFFIGFKV